MDPLLQDLRYAWRLLLRQPAFFSLVVLTLALGIGANTAIFSVFNAVILRPLPYPEPERLVQIKKDLPGFGINPLVVFREFLAWQSHCRGLTQIVAYETGQGNLSGTDEAERVTFGRVSEQFFQLLQVKPELGRTLSPEDGRPGAPPVVVLGHGLWKRRFGGDAGILGKIVKLDLETYTIIGVLPPQFELASRYSIHHDLWAPLKSDAHAKYGMPVLVEVVGRLKPGVSGAGVASELDTISSSEFKARARGKTVVVGWQNEILGDLKLRLIVLLSAVSLVLLIACANVANLMLSRAATREKEIAVRAALGAGRWRLVRQLLTESFTLSLLGGLFGLALAFWAKNLLFSAISENVAHIPAVGIDRYVLVFTVAVTLLTGLLFGIAPALRSARVQLVESLKEGSRGSQGPGRYRMTSVLVVTEVALALVLLLGAGLLLRSLLLLQNVNPGFRPDRILTMTVDLTPARYPKPHDQSGYFERVLERVQRLPGVLSAGLDSCVPFGGFGMSGDFEIAGRPSGDAKQPEFLSLAVVSDEYFHAMDIPLRRGRLFSRFDREGAPAVAIVNEALARRFFPNEDPLGKQIKVGKDDWLTIVGVVGDVRQGGLDRDTPHLLYKSYLQDGTPFMSLVVRTRGDPMKMAGAVRSQVAGIDRDQPAYAITTLEQALSDSLHTRKVNLRLLGAFALLAVALAAVGIYGVVFYNVSRRVQEIGIRMALGAQRADVIRIVVGRSMLQCLLGIAIGLSAAAGLTRFMSGLIYGITATDPITFAAISAVLMAVSLLASALPTRKATRVDPVEALRYE